MKNVSPENTKIFWMAPILVLAIGTFPLPIGYYTLSRLVVCTSAIYFAYNFYKKKIKQTCGYLDLLQFYIIQLFLFIYTKKLFGL